MTAPKKRPGASRPRRLVTVRLVGDYEGCYATLYADMKARLADDLNSEDIGRVLAALTTLVTDHNLPDGEAPDEVAATMGDVDTDLLRAVIEGYSEELGKLPPR